MVSVKFLSMVIIRLNFKDTISIYYCYGFYVLKIFYQDQCSEKFENASFLVVEKFLILRCVVHLQQVDLCILFSLRELLIQGASTMTRPDSYLASVVQSVTFSHTYMYVVVHIKK